MTQDQEFLVQIPAGEVALEGDLRIPDEARGVVVFAHGSGSGRHSPRNFYVAQQLRNEGLGTLLLDLLTSQEEAEDMRTATLRFDVNLLADRLIVATDWLRQNISSKELSIGYFGASTGAAGALLADAERPGAVAAIVSRGGRPDLAGKMLTRVTAPTLLIVGGDDAPVVKVNEEALMVLNSQKKMVAIPGATHLFEEPGALEKVAALAADWFAGHFQQQ